MFRCSANSTLSISKQLNENQVEKAMHTTSLITSQTVTITLRPYTKKFIKYITKKNIIINNIKVKYLLNVIIYKPRVLSILIRLDMLIIPKHLNKMTK